MGGQTGSLWIVVAVALLVSGAGCGPVQESAEPAATESRMAEGNLPEGTIHVPAFDLPPSAALSAEARQLAVAGQRAGAGAGAGASFPDTSSIATEEDFAEYVANYRSGLDSAFAKPLADAVMEAFPVEMQAAEIAGVPVEEFEPAAGISPENENRVLINLHGGAFMAGAVYLGRVESAPISALAKMRVVSVDYRQGHEHKFPAASEDVAAVYQALLERYPASNVGIYGCSAGGALTAQTTAWLLEKGIPTPGAIGIFGSGAGPGAGDARYFSAIASGTVPPPASQAPRPSRSGRFGYYSNISQDDPLVYPIKDPEQLAKFPPTLLITATRATDMSRAIETHRALTRAGVDASLQLFDGLGHCFIYSHQLPEVEDANATIVRFFDRHLGR